MRELRIILRYSGEESNPCQRLRAHLTLCDLYSLVGIGATQGAAGSGYSQQQESGGGEDEDTQFVLRDVLEMDEVEKGND